VAESVFDSFRVYEAANSSVRHVRSSAAVLASTIEAAIHPHPDRDRAISLLRQAVIAAETAYLAAGGPGVVFSETPATPLVQGTATSPPPIPQLQKRSHKKGE